MNQLKSVAIMMANEMSPFKRIDYIEQCADRIYRINNNNNIENGHHDRHCLIIIIICQWLFMLRLLLTYLSPNIPEYRFIFIDLSYLFKLDEKLNLIAIPMCFLVQYFYQIWYLNFHLRLYSIVCKIFYEQNGEEFFLYKYFIFHSKSYDCCQFIRYNVYRFLCMFQLIIIVLNFFNIFLHYTYIRLFIVNEKIYPKNLIGFSLITITEMNCLFTLFVLYCMAHILIFVTIGLFLFTVIVFIKLGQCDHLLKSIMHRWRQISIQQQQQQRQQQQQHSINDYNHIERFMMEHTDTLLVIETMDGQYSHMLTTFLMATTPLNIFLMGSLIIQYQQQSLLEGLLTLSMALQQWIGVFGAHLLCAYFSIKIHKCSKCLLSMAANCTSLSSNRQRRWWLLRKQIRLSNYIEKFHTNNHYGLTYSKITLISVKSFAKVCIYIYDNNI